MQEGRGDLFECIGKVDFIGITTNGTVKSNGSAVMGRGCALQAKTRWRGLDEYLGSLLRQHGNMPCYLGVVDRFKVWRKGDVRRAPDETGLISFPVKHRWDQRADIELIKKSADLVKLLVSLWPQCQVVVPRPGCGNGGLNWADVKPQLEPLLDNRFTIISNEV
jgi:hypothetical protein